MPFRGQHRRSDSLSHCGGISKFAAVNAAQSCAGTHEMSLLQQNPCKGALCTVFRYEMKNIFIDCHKATGGPVLMVLDLKQLAYL